MKKGKRSVIGIQLKGKTSTPCYLHLKTTTPAPLGCKKRYSDGDSSTLSRSPAPDPAPVVCRLWHRCVCLPVPATVPPLSTRQTHTHTQTHGSQTCAVPGRSGPGGMGETGHSTGLQRVRRRNRGAAATSVVGPHPTVFIVQRRRSAEEGYSRLDGKVWA